MTPAVLLENLGAEIRARRLALDMTQEGLAFEAHVHPNLVGRIERGEDNPTVLTLNALTEVLGCTLGDLFIAAERRAYGSPPIG